MTNSQLKNTPDYKLNGKQIIQKRSLLKHDKLLHNLDKKLTQVITLLSNRARYI